MNEEKLRLYIGEKIKEFRKKKKMTQGELGMQIGVKNNTISAYERGSISPDSDILFRIANALDIEVDNLFPPAETKNVNYLNKIKDLSNEEFDAKEMLFFQKLIEKALSLEGEERAKFMESIKFTVEFYNKMNDE
ncbi:helix-turn-helix domain-containing protein [Cytobacillus kochii]|uniref:helix-turn-helix domain-containing protein n=1 Tax=Cytobacillus kochii TaxID=859143 RepID=UPI0025A02BDE|nr:helix-turn-helix transcriptional regulator [Cytobacillus kochii]MDM5208445.1 helix-turn-helix transcriptional regulator [Cytobacillus kochii]